MKMRKGDKVKLKDGSTGEIKLIYHSKDSGKPYKVTVILDSQYGSFSVNKFVSDVEVI